MVEGRKTNEGKEREREGNRDEGTRKRVDESTPVRRGEEKTRREGESPKTVVGSSPLLRIQRHNGIDNVTGVTSITFSFCLCICVFLSSLTSLCSAT